MELAVPTGPWTEEDLPDEDRLVELLEGTLVVNAPPSGLHQLAVKRLVQRIDSSASAGYEAVEAVGVRIPGGSYFIPDVALVSVERLTADTSTFEPADVALVAEVVSPSSQSLDREVKPRIYAQAGIPEYWLVEIGGRVEESIVHVYRLAEGAYVQERSFPLGR